MIEAMTEFEEDYSSWIDVIATRNVSTNTKASESVRMYSTYKQTRQAVLKAKAEGVDVSNELARLKEVGPIILREGLGLEEEE